MSPIYSGDASNSYGWQENSASAVYPDQTNTGTWYGVAVKGSKRVGTGQGKKVYLRDLTGSQPASSAVLTKTTAGGRTLVGSQPSGSGALTRILSTARALAGSQPASTATLTGTKTATSRNLAGNQPVGGGGAVFSDDFSDGTMDTSKWTIGLLAENDWAGGTVTVIEAGDGTLQITPYTQNYNGYVSVNHYNLEGGSVTVRYMRGDDYQTGMYGGLTVGGDNDHYAAIVAGDATGIWVNVDGDDYPVGPVTGVASGSWQWWRIAGSGGTLAFSTSPDGTNWTTIYDNYTPTFDITNALVAVAAGSWLSGMPTRTDRFDDFDVAALPTILFSDDFNRADSTTIGGNWAEIGGNWEIISGAVREPTSSGGEILRSSSAIGTADYSVQATLTQATLVSQGSVGMGLVARLSDNVNYYLAWLNEFGTDYILYNVSGGSFNEIGRWSTTALADPVTLTLDCRGSTIRILVNGTQRVSATNTQHTGEGDFGFRVYNGVNFQGHRFDNVAVLTTTGAAGTLAAQKLVARSFTGDQPASSGTLIRRLQTSRTLAGAQPAPSGTLTRRLQAIRSSVGSQPSPAGALIQSKLTLRSLTGSQPAGSSVLTRAVITARSLAGAQPSPSATLTRRLQAARVAVGSQPASSGALIRRLQAVRALLGSQPASTASLARAKVALRSLAGSQPSAAAVLVRKLQAIRSLLGSGPASTGALGRRLAALRSLASPQPSSTATLAAQRLGAPERSLAGQQPAGSATLARRYTGARALQGSAPGGQGELSRRAFQHETLVGVQPAPTGALVANKAALKVLAGTQPASTGSLQRTKFSPRILVGSQPSATSTLTRRLSSTRILVGSQPQPTALLVRRISLHLSLAGVQIFSTATLTTTATGTRIVAGIQIAAYGDLIVVSAGRQITQEARILGKRSGVMALGSGRRTSFSLPPDGTAVLANGRSAVLSRRQMDTVLEVEKA